MNSREIHEEIVPNVMCGWGWCLVKMIVMIDTSVFLAIVIEVSGWIGQERGNHIEEVKCLEVTWHVLVYG